MCLLYTKQQLTEKLRSLGYGKEFQKFSVIELYGFGPDQCSTYLERDLKNWLDCHCNRPMTQDDYENADHYYSFDTGMYKQYSNWLYYIVKGLLSEDIEKFLTHLH